MNMVPRSMSCGACLLMGLAFLVSGPKLSTGQGDNAPPCTENNLRCPVSRACYPPHAVCDSYDDCGTGFDEVNCPMSDECIESIFVPFDSACGNERRNGTFDSRGLDFAIDGQFFYGIPFTGSDSELPYTRVWIDRVYLDWGTNQQDFPETVLTDEGYFMLTISSFSGLNITNSTVVTLHLTANESQIQGGVVKKLREPFEINLLDIDSVEVMLSFVGDASPSSETPYAAPEALNFGTVEVEFVRFPELVNVGDLAECAFNIGQECLEAAWPYIDQSSATSCQPLERRQFVSSLYDSCISPPQIISISENVAAYPGDSVEISCVVFASPQPVVSLLPLVDPEGAGEPAPFGPVLVSQLVVLSNGTNTTFTCTAENVAGIVTSTFQVTALDYRCPGLTDDLMAFQQNLTECAPVLQLTTSEPISQSFFTFPISQDGILQSLPLTLFETNPEVPFNFPTIFSFRVVVTADQILFRRAEARRKRDIFKILYEKDYRNITLVNGAITVEFIPPVFVTQGTILYVNLLDLADGSPLDLNNFAPQGPLSYLQCPLSPPLNPINNASCYDQLDRWTAMEDTYIGIGCAEGFSVPFRTYETCLRSVDAQPVVTGEVSVPDLRILESYDIACPIEGAVRRQWWRRSSRGLMTPFESPSPFLRFLPFTAGDMGYYHCEGYGGGAYRDETVATAPVLFAVEGVATLAVSVTFYGPFIDFENTTTFDEFASTFRQPLQDAFFNVDGGRLSSSLLDDIESLSFPTIVNTRRGSTVVDYVMNFNGSHWNNMTELVSRTTSRLVSELEGSSNPEQLNLTVPGSIVVSSASSCPESVVMGTFGTLTFPDTPLDQTADSQEHCSDYSNNTPLPRATRRCRGDLLSSAVWDDPVLVDCFMGEDTNQVLDNIAGAIVTAENVTEYSYDVAEATENAAEINSDNIRAVADALQNIVNVGNPSPEVTNNTLQIVDNVLGVPDEEFVAAVDVRAPTRILDLLEEQVTLFQTQGDGNNLTIVGRSVAVVALQLPRDSLLEGLGFATFGSPNAQEESSVLNNLNENDTVVYTNPDEIPKSAIDAAIVLPPKILDLIPEELLANGTVPVTFFIFQTSQLFISPEQVYDLGQGRRLAVGTRVISATVEGVVIQGLPRGSEVETAFLELNVTLDNEMIDNRTCVFWDKTSQGGRWSSEGCRREDDPAINRIRCLCDHLTSFAVLLDVSGDVGYYALDVLSLIGCIISIICLVITLVTYLSMKKLRSKQPQRILINLCFALLGLYLVFVIGIDRRYPTAGCVVVGFLIHFFLLSSMSWMLVEAVNMYLLFVKVLNASVSRFMLKAAICAYGLPLLVCIITVAVDSTIYLGDDTYCFVKPGPALYYGVLLIVALLLCVNFIIFGLVMYRLSCRKSVAAHKTEQSSHGEMWRRVQNAVAISVLLGLTWLFGFFAIGGARLAFNILFLVFNSLQGFFVFLMFCIRQKEVRDQWKRWLRCEFGEVKPGQRSRDDYVQAKYKKTAGSEDGRTTLGTSSNQGIQLSSGGTLSTNASSITT